MSRVISQLDKSLEKEKKIFPIMSETNSVKNPDKSEFKLIITYIIISEQSNNFISAED